jgi:hypothetical protein
MQHLAAFAESIDPGGALVNIAAVNDDSVFTSGDDIRVPVELPYLAGEAALISATTPIQAQFQSPSLRQVANIDVEPAALGLVFGDPAELALHMDSPIRLRGDESLNFLVNTNPAAAEVHYGLAWFTDGPVQPVTGDIFSVRATMSVTGVANAWVSGGLTFAQDLPVGNYDVVGMRVRAAGLVAARLNFVGGAFRPGVPGAVAIDDVIGMQFRYGKAGVLGRFHTNTPPQIEVLAAAAAITPVVILDLIQRG